MHSPRRAPAVQGRRAQAAALADALASLDRTRGRMDSLSAYGNRGPSRAPGRLGGRAGPGGHPVTPGNFGVRPPEGGEGREWAAARALSSGSGAPWGLEAARNLEKRAFAEGGGGIKSGEIWKVSGSAGTPETSSSLQTTPGLGWGGRLAG